MNKRKYISVEPVYSMTKKRGVITGHTIKGENTHVTIHDKVQSDDQVILHVTFEDFNYSTTVKCLSNYPDEGRYAQYVACLMEEDSLEEVYKTALLIADIHLRKLIKLWKKMHRDYLAGRHCYPMCKSNVKQYLKDIKEWEEISDSIDVHESDLVYL